MGLLRAETLVNALAVFTSFWAQHGLLEGRRTCETDRVATSPFLEGGHSDKERGVFYIASIGFCNIARAGITSFAAWLRIVAGSARSQI